MKQLNLDPTRRTGLRRGWLWLVIICATVLVALGVSGYKAIAFFRPAASRTHRVEMVTDLVPLRVYIAEQVREEGTRHSLDLILSQQRYGSLDSLAAVDNSNEIKLALVPGGVKTRDYPRVRQVAILATEPLHVLLKPELAPKGLSGLRGKRVALGPPTTASHHVAREVLAHVGIRPDPAPSGYILAPGDSDTLYRELQRIESLGASERAAAIQALPDALLFLAPTPSMLAKKFVQSANYHLLAIPFAEAFCRERLTVSSSEGVHVDRSVFTTTVIPPYTYGHEPPTPAQPCVTVGVPLLLIAQDHTDPEAVTHVLETIYDSPLVNVLRPMPLRDQVAVFPLHPGTDRYLHRNDPLLTPEVVSKLGTLAGGVGTFITGLIAIYSFMRLRRLHRFEAYYRDIGRIDMLARGLEVDPDAPTDSVVLRTHLETKLTQLKHDVLKDFAAGGLQGEGLMAGIIALINDTRESLAGMATGNTGGPDTASTN